MSDMNKVNDLSDHTVIHLPEAPLTDMWNFIGSTEVRHSGFSLP